MKRCVDFKVDQMIFICLEMKMCQVNISVSPNIDLSSARLMLHCQDCQSGLLFTRLISISLLSEKISNIKRGMDLLHCKHKIKVLPLLLSLLWWYEQFYLIFAKIYPETHFMSHNIRASHILQPTNQSTQQKMFYKYGTMPWPLEKCNN